MVPSQGHISEGNEVQKSEGLSGHEQGYWEWESSGRLGPSVHMGQKNPLQKHNFFSLSSFLSVSCLAHN